MSTPQSSSVPPPCPSWCTKQHPGDGDTDTVRTHGHRIPVDRSLTALQAEVYQTSVSWPGFTQTEEWSAPAVRLFYEPTSLWLHFQKPEDVRDIAALLDVVSVEATAGLVWEASTVLEQALAEYQTGQPVSK